MPEFVWEHLIPRDGSNCSPIHILQDENGTVLVEQDEESIVITPKQWDELCRFIREKI